MNWALRRDDLDQLITGELTPSPLYCQHRNMRKLKIRGGESNTRPPVRGAPHAASGLSRVKGINHHTQGMDRTAGERCYSGFYAGPQGGRSGPEHFEARGTASARQRLIVVDLAIAPR